MTAAMAMPSNTAATFLTHFFGAGIVEDICVVERFRGLVNGDIRRCPDEAPAKGGGRSKTKHATATLKAIRDMRPARNEIIVCTGLRTRGGVQYRGSTVTGLPCDRKQPGWADLPADVRPGILRPKRDIERE